MTHHSTSGRTSTGELLLRILLRTDHRRSIRMCFKLELVCAQDRKDSESGESRPGFYFPVRSAGETLLHTHCIHLDTVYWDKQHVESRLNISFLFHFQEKNFLQMVEDAGSPGIEKQIVRQKNLTSLEARYEETLQELANVIKVTARTRRLDFSTRT